MKIEGLPDGWEVVAFRRPEKGDWYVTTNGTVTQARTDFNICIMPVLRKVWDYAAEQAAWVKEHGIRESCSSGDGSPVRIGEVDPEDYRLRGYTGMSRWDMKRKFAGLVVPVLVIQGGGVTCRVEENGNWNHYDFPFFALTPLKKTWKPWDVNTMPARVQVRPKAEFAERFPRAPYWVHPADKEYACLGLSNMLTYARLFECLEQTNGTPCGIEVAE